MRRRTLLAAAGSLAAGLAVGCSAESQPRSEGKGKLTWWDHTSGNEDLVSTFFADFTADTGIDVEYTYQQSSKLGEALQIAHGSDQLPDIMTTAGLNLSFPALIEDGWMQPLQWNDEQHSRIGPEMRAEGINTLDGELYSFPIRGSRFFNANVWYNQELLDRAGVAPPTTWDEFRDACATIKQELSPVRGLIINSDATFGAMVDNTAQSAGFAGSGGTLFTTGEIRWHDDTYVAWLDLLLGLYRDGHVVEGQFNSDTARGRFLAGQCAFLIDGIWTVATTKETSEEFVAKLGVCGPLTPERGQEPLMYRNQEFSLYWVSGQSRNPDMASELLARMTTPEYSKFVARRMYQVPVDSAQLDDPAVEPIFRDQVRKALPRVFMMPQLARKNPETHKIMSTVKPVRPDMAEIFQGMVSGQLTDLAGALRTLSDDETAARQEVLADNNLTVDDVSFPNWKPEQDYTEQMYRA